MHVMPLRGMHLLLWLVAAMGLSLAAAPVQAGPEGFRFDVSLAGFRVGEVRFTGKTDGSRYEMQGVMGSKGFFGGLINRRYSGAVIGQQLRGSLRPQVFRGRFEQRRQYAQVDIRYANGIPTEVLRTPARPAKPFDIKLSAARDALDPISGTYFLLRNQGEGSLCKQNFRVFEGNRLARIVLGRAKESAEIGAKDSVICNGAYTRLSGFSPEQMADRKTFPFELRYERVNDTVWRVQEFTMTTYWGTAKAVRR